MSDDPESDNVEREAQSDLAKMIAGAEAAMKKRAQEEMAKREAAMAAEASLTRTLNTPEALDAMARTYFTNPEPFQQYDVVDWKGEIFKDRRSYGPFIVLKVVERMKGHVLSSADGDNFEPGTPLWGQVLDLCVAQIASDKSMRVMWVDSYRMTKYTAPAVRNESTKPA